MLLGHRYYDNTTGRFLSQDPAQDESNWYGYCGNSPLVATDPSGLADIDLGFRPVGGPAYHAYIIVKDPSGKESYISGGPSKSGLAALGSPITIYSGPFNDKSYDWPSGGPEEECTRPRRHIYHDNRPAKYWFDKFREEGRVIKLAKTPYDPLGTNSNSVASSLLLYVIPGGNRPETWNLPVWLPGYGYPLPRWKPLSMGPAPGPTIGPAN